MTDTTGSGDCFHAAYLAARNAGLDGLGPLAFCQCGRRPQSAALGRARRFADLCTGGGVFSAAWLISSASTSSWMTSSSPTARPAWACWAAADRRRPSVCACGPNPWGWPPVSARICRPRPSSGLRKPASTWAPCAIQNTPPRVPGRRWRKTAAAPRSGGCRRQPSRTT